MLDIDWDEILENLKSGQCVFVLGPELFPSVQCGKSLSDAMQDLLPKKKDNRDEVAFYREDGFFFFTGSLSQTLNNQLASRLKKFYEPEASQSKIYEILIEIPALMYISLSPDCMINEAFEKKRYSYVFDFFNYEKKPNEFDPPSVENPLVYNLMGCVDDQNTLILTYDKLFDYLPRIFSKETEPKSLINELSKVSRFILLGFQYDKWYFNLLFRLLGMNKTESNALCNIDPKDPNLSFYSRHFRFDFINTDPQSFLQELTEKCTEQKIPLRSQLNKADPIKRRLLDLLADLKNNYGKLLDQIFKDYPILGNEVEEIRIQYKRALTEYNKSGNRQLFDEEEDRVTGRLHDLINENYD